VSGGSVSNNKYRDAPEKKKVKRAEGKFNAQTCFLLHRLRFIERALGVHARRIFGESDTFDTIWLKQRATPNPLVALCCFVYSASRLNRKEFKCTRQAIDEVSAEASSTVVITLWKK
jgi:hypothetical protein